MRDAERKPIMLIVDDDAINRAILANIFEADYAILEAENGAEGWQWIRAHADALSAVLLDVVMPEMNGLELMRHLAQEGFAQKTPVFLITADASNATMQEAYSLGVMDVISKPVVPYIVRRRVESVVELFEARRRLSAQVARQQDQLLRQAQQLAQMGIGMVEALATAIEFRSDESGEHVRRIHDITCHLLRHTPLGVLKTVPSFPARLCPLPGIGGHLQRGVCRLKFGRHVGVRVDPGQKRFGGDADAGTKPADRKVLAVRQFVRRRCADAKITFDVGNRQVMFFKNAVRIIFTVSHGSPPRLLQVEKRIYQTLFLPDAPLAKVCWIWYSKGAEIGVKLMSAFGLTGCCSTLYGLFARGSSQLPFLPPFGRGSNRSAGCGGRAHERSCTVRLRCSG